MGRKIKRIDNNNNYDNDNQRNEYDKVSSGYESCERK